MEKRNLFFPLRSRSVHTSEACPTVFFFYDSDLLPHREWHWVGQVQLNSNSSHRHDRWCIIGMSHDWVRYSNGTSAVNNDNLGQFDNNPRNKQSCSYHAVSFILFWCHIVMIVQCTAIYIHDKWQCSWSLLYGGRPGLRYRVSVRSRNGSCLN